jgi:hypothetical protein
MKNMFTVTYGGQVKKYAQITPSADGVSSFLSNYYYQMYSKFLKLCQKLQRHSSQKASFQTSSD